METLTPEYPVEVSARHMPCTEAIRNYIITKLARIHLAYPKIIDAKAVVDTSKHGEKVTIVLNCSNHIVIESDTETRNLYEAIDQTVEKLARQMRKAKTKRLKQMCH